MGLDLLPSEVLRTSCRQRLEACELWLRRLVHDALVKDFGDDYINTATLSGNSLFRADIRTHVASRLATQSSKSCRPIDTLLLDHLSAVICKEDAFRNYFAAAMRYGFPTGREHLRLVLRRLVPVRNALSHANPISLHDAERVLCYCSDIITSLTEHYESLGMSREFDAPSFTRYSDSLGRIRHPRETDEQLNFVGDRAFRAGDSIRLEVEVDAHYPPSDYVVKWQVCNLNNAEHCEGTCFTLTLLPRHVSTSFVVMASVVSNKEWHRHGSHDARLVLVYTVLPPVNAC